MREGGTWPDPGQAEKRPARVLLIGGACLEYGPDLQDGFIDIVGYAENVEEAARVLDSLRPDVVLVEPHSPDDTPFLRIALALASAMPSRRLICLSGIAED